MLAMMVCSLLTFLMAGCSTLSSGGAPKQSFDIDADLKALSEKFEQSTKIDDFYNQAFGGNPGAELTPEQKESAKRARNKFITGRMVMIDLRYIEFIRGLTRDRALIDSSADLAIMSLNLAGTAVGGATAKTVLAALSAGIAGTKTTIDRDFFYEKTVPALVASMNAQRAATRVELIRGLQQDIDAYPFHTAVVGVQSYYESGTFIGALSAIQAEAGATEKTSKAIAQEIVDRGEGYFVDLKKVIGAIKNLSEANVSKAWIAFKPIADKWAALQSPAVTVTPPTDVVSYKKMFDAIWPKLDSTDRTAFYNNLTREGVISP
jgi:hypothetical protein